MAAPPLPSKADYTLVHRWSTGTDADTEAYDTVSYLTRPGVTVSGIGRATHRAFAPPGTPACDDVLPNTDGRYSPGGILGGFVGRGPVTTFEADWGTDILGNDPDVLGNDPDVLGNGRLTRRLFTGNIDTAPQTIDRPTASVQVRSLGRVSLLNDHRPRIALQENIRTDEAITLVLDAVGWPAEDRVLDTGDTDLLYFWANGDRTASDLVNLILGAEGVPSCAYEDGQGRFHFEGRQFRANNARSTTVQWTLTDTPGTGVLCHVVPAQWSANPDEVVKDVKATVNVRTATSTQKVWEYGGTLTLTGNETRDIEATASDPFKSATTPASGTDYTVSAGSLSSVTLLEDAGQTVRIRLVAGASGATVIGVTSNGIQLRAVSLPVTTTVPLTSTVDTDLASARYRPRDHTLNLWPEVEPNQALDLVNNFARRYQRPRDQMTVQVVNYNADHMHAMLNMRVSDRVLIQHTRAAINQEFFIESMTHVLADGGGVHRLTLNCERVTDDQPAQFGTARFGFDSFTE